MKIKKDAVEKEFLCVKNTYVSDDKFDKNRIMDEDTYPFLAPLKLIKVKDKNTYEKRLFSGKEIPTEILLYAIG